MPTQTKLLVAILVLVLIAVALAGLAVYRTYHVPPPAEASVPTAPPAPAPTAAPPAAEQPAEKGGHVTTPTINIDMFGAGGQYKCVRAESFDLLGDGGREWIIGYQDRQTDDLGYPKKKAYFVVARYDESKGEWAKWFTISPPGDEHGLDDRSIRAIGQMQGNQVFVELMFYGFGVSSRPEPVCLYEITEQGAQPVTKPFPIPKTSDDVVLSYDVSPDSPGDEEIFAQAVMGGEAHAAPHRFKLTTYGWKGGIYAPVKTQTTSKAYENGIAAIENAFSVDFN